MTSPNAATPGLANRVPALVLLLRRALQNNWVLFYLGFAPMLTFDLVMAKLHLSQQGANVYFLVSWLLLALVLYVLALRWLRMLPPTPNWARFLSLAGVSLVAAWWAVMPLRFAVEPLEEPLASQPAFAATMTVLVAGAVFAVVGVCVRAFPLVRQAIRDGWDPPLPPEAH